MLNFMRRNSNSWVMIFVFAIIVFVFVVNFGPWAGNNLTGIPHAAVVNNVSISMADFRTAYTSQFARIKQFRPDYNQESAEKDGLKQMVVEQLVTRELLDQLGAKKHLKVSAKDLAEEIKERVFGKEAEFNKEEYVRRINSYFQTSVSEFEHQVAKEMVAQNMSDVLSTAIFVPDEEVKKEYMDRNTQVSIEFVKINPNSFSVSPISPELVKQFQEKHADEISAYYNKNISQYVKEPEIKASHILIKVPQNVSESEKLAQKAKAEKILERIKKNEDFATLAKSESEDTGSKENGGDLGFFSSGMMVEEFSNAAFKLKPGEVSGLVESPFGFHIIKQTDSRPKMEKKVEEVSPEIAQILIKKEEQDKLAKQEAEQALAELKAGEALSKIKVSKLIHKVEPSSNTNANISGETELFNRTQTVIGKIGRAGAISEKAFALTKENPTPKDIIEANGSFFAIRLKSRQDPDMAKFEEQKDSIKNSLLYPRKRSFVQQYITYLKSQAKITYNENLMKLPVADI
jgi:peptidyl-prolyl cis-trans isomerase D